MRLGSAGNYSEYENAFGPFASWLGKARGLRDPSFGDPDTLDDLLDNAKRGAVHELMLLLVAYEHLISIFVNGHGGFGHGRYHQNKPVWRGRSGKSLWFFLMFIQVEKITMPVDIEVKAPVSTALPSRGRVRVASTWLRRAMNTLDCDEARPEIACKKAEVWSSEQRDHVDQRHGSSTQTGLRDVQKSEAEAKDIFEAEAGDIRCHVY